MASGKKHGSSLTLVAVNRMFAYYHYISLQRIQVNIYEHIIAADTTERQWKWSCHRTTLPQPQPRPAVAGNFRCTKLPTRIYSLPPCRTIRSNPCFRNNQQWLSIRQRDHFRLLRLVITVMNSEPFQSLSAAQLFFWRLTSISNGDKSIKPKSFRFIFIYLFITFTQCSANHN